MIKHLTQWSETAWQPQSWQPTRSVILLMIFAPVCGSSICRSTCSKSSSLIKTLQVCAFLVAKLLMESQLQLWATTLTKLPAKSDKEMPGTTLELFWWLQPSCASLPGSTSSAHREERMPGILSGLPFSMSDGLPCKLPLFQLLINWVTVSASATKWSLTEMDLHMLPTSLSSH